LVFLPHPHQKESRAAAAAAAAAAANLPKRRLHYPTAPSDQSPRL
jgi:hypothetical protein